MNMNELYAIGDVARRTGLSVSAVRYYADAGVVTPDATTPAGHRLYDVSAIARLELVRTLRELDAGLDEIRRVLAGEATLRELATTHLALLARQETRLRSRRAVLSALLRQDSTAEQVTLMHKLVGMPDEERDRLIDEFWAEVSTGWEPPQRMVDWWRAARPELPEQPTAAQLEAWIELAELVRDPEVRQAVRHELHQACTTGAGPLMSSPPMLDTLETGAAIGQPVLDAARERVPPDSPRGRGIADQWIGWLTGIFATPDSPGLPDTPEFRIQAADRMLAGAEWDRMPAEGPFDRYMELVATVNDDPPERFPYEWLAAALRASALPARCAG
ncbi:MULTISPECIES: MerR family transcriptional regulator [unclassified Micromonospora]|uniref:MerR family transcriptional regulator n=1 Tax=unclassified Micromonospora TaxID=2617518 RepID=UPI001C5DD966|nr:MerR family transcriptional regulator [Micromonospora sp. RL09-050-HVF-A]MBW4706147.1 MerR family transcriptional regulator [Micromonospora sp. RL09-050-HVF-A]